MRRLHAQLRPSRTSTTGRHVQSVGVRFGYWPCLHAPFVSVDLGSLRLDLWFGFPSYRPGARL